MEKGQPVYLSSGAVQNLVLACRVAIKHYSALVERSTGDTRITHENMLIGLHCTLERLQPLNESEHGFLSGAWKVVWEPGPQAQRRSRGE